MEYAHRFGTEEQWRFYFSLTSLLLVFGMLFSLVLVLVIQSRYTQIQQAFMTAKR
jgi:hypothetical protein